MDSFDCLVMGNEIGSYSNHILANIYCNIVLWFLYMPLYNAFSSYFSNNPSLYIFYNFSIMSHLNNTSAFVSWSPSFHSLNKPTDLVLSPVNSDIPIHHRFFLVSPEKHIFHHCFYLIYCLKGRFLYSNLFLEFHFLGSIYVGGL